MLDFFWQFLALLTALRPRAIVPLGVQRGAFGQQELCSRDLALARRHVERRLTSGGVPGRRPFCLQCTTAQRPTPGNVESYGQLNSTGSTHKRKMNMLDSTSSNCSKQNAITNNHKRTEQASRLVVSNKLASMKKGRL